MTNLTPPPTRGLTGTLNTMLANILSSPYEDFTWRAVRLSHGLAIAMRPTPEGKIQFAISRMDIDPSTSEWHTCLNSLSQLHRLVIPPGLEPETLVTRKGHYFKFATLILIPKLEEV